MRTPPVCSLHSRSSSSTHAAGGMPSSDVLTITKSENQRDAGHQNEAKDDAAEQGVVDVGVEANAEP